MRRALAAVVVIVLAACGERTEEPAAPLRTPAEDGKLLDLDPAPGIVHVSLEAVVARVEFVPGKSTEVWAYRDAGRPGSSATVPGPMLEAQAGDEVIVDFRNELPQKTTIHWHGVRVANLMDGSNVTQTPIAPGATFQYRFKVPDAGSFWFHPHLSADTQIERGLYAPIVVHGPEELDVSEDRYLVLDDAKLQDDGSFDPTTTMMDTMVGRQGNTLLVSGRANARMEARRGTRELWRIVNVANGSYFDLEVPGHRFLLIGGDGGLLAQPREVERLLVVPGERYEVLVTLDGEPGETLSLRRVHYDRGHDLPDPGPQDLLAVHLSKEAGSPGELPTTFGSFDPIDTSAATPRRFTLEESEGHHAMVFSINGEAWPEVTPVAARRGAVEVWDVVNTTPMDHPFHLHGYFFQVLDGQGSPDPAIGWKDTVNVPRGSTLRVAVRLDAEGQWMYHCHILEHAEAGMMGMLEVKL